MPYVRPPDQLGLEGLYRARWIKEYEEGYCIGLRDSIPVLLRVRFGPPGLALMPRVEKVTDPGAVEAFLNAAETADLAALDALLPPA